jgi:8-oxo-dGTP pyrophosphatase MutT (NUDIX family)
MPDWGTVDITAEHGAPIRLASTVALLRDGERGLEVLMVKRASTLEFHGGAWVFPGGRIDDADWNGSDDELAAAQRAAARETLEEANVGVDPDALQHFAHWTTPDFMPKRFATWFFVGAVGDHADEAADGVESDALEWWTPSDALAARNRHEIDLGPPQYVTCHSLSRYESVGAALGGLAAEEPFVFLPRFARSDEGPVCLYGGDVAYDDFERLAEPSPRHRLVMASAADWQYQRA